MALNRQITSFQTQQIVTHELSTKPYVGFEHLTDSPDGWLYDIRRWSSPFDLRIPTLPRLVDPSIQGLTPSEYFKSGVGDKDLGDLKVKEIREYTANDRQEWIPILENGVYYRYNTDFFCYSDNSKVEYINPNNNRDGRNYIELSETPATTTPILAASFQRDKKRQKDPCNADGPC